VIQPTRRHSAVATATLNRIAFVLHDKQEFVMPRANKIEEWPRRPPRLHRLFQNARPFYFVTFNTYKRQKFLARPEVHEAFCIFCSKAQEHDIAVGRYVIMPDHVHLFVALPIDELHYQIGSNRCAR
jgi:hypothetical protein